MTRHSHSDPVENLLFAKQRDLLPLLEQCVAELELDHEQTLTMEDLLSEAWRIGAPFGQAQAFAQIGGEGEEVKSPDFEAELKPLVESAIGHLDLSLHALIAASTYLSQAVIAGAKAFQAETVALAIEHSHDLGDEALKWLDGRGDSRGN